MLALLAALLPSSVRAAVTTLQPSSQDAFVERDNPGVNFGSSTRIRVQNAPVTAAAWRGLVQFDLSAIPQFSTINAATLGLYESVDVSPARTHAVHVVTQPWQESVVTWNNQPGFAASSTATFNTGSKGFKNLTVTADVQAWVDSPASN